jgi:hypothetical protein
VILVNRRSKSLKTVIPRQVVDMLKIKPDDVLQWDVDIKKNIVRVKILKFTINHFLFEIPLHGDMIFYEA